jgi:hypothetical protein
MRKLNVSLYYQRFLFKAKSSMVQGNGQVKKRKSSVCPYQTSEFPYPIFPYMIRVRFLVGRKFNKNELPEGYNAKKKKLPHFIFFHPCSHHHSLLILVSKLTLSLCIFHLFTSASSNFSNWFQVKNSLQSERRAVV